MLILLIYLSTASKEIAIKIINSSCWCPSSVESCLFFSISCLGRFNLMHTLMFQLAHHFENASSKRRSMWSYCSIKVASLVACISPCLKWWLLQYGKMSFLCCYSFFMGLYLFKIMCMHHYWQRHLVTGINSKLPWWFFFTSGRLPHIPRGILELF